jgi:hypothetical protein
MDKYEKIISQEFESMKIPESDMVQAVQKRLSARRVGFFKKKSFVAVFAVFMLMFSTAVAAQVIRHFNSFERLTEILDTETAERLQPIEAFLTSLNADDIYGMENIVTSDGLRIELIAVGAGNYEIDVFLLLEDLSGEHVIGEEMWVNQFLRFTDPALAFLSSDITQMGRVNEFDVIERYENTAILHMQMEYPRLPQDAEIGSANVNALTLFIEGITLNRTRHYNVQTGLSLDVLPQNLSPTHSLTLAEAYIVGESRIYRFPGDITRSMHFGQPLEEGVAHWIIFAREGDLKLVPNSLNIPFEAAGESMYISAAGVVDGDFRLQIYKGEHNFGILHLVHSNGTIVTANDAFRFRLDENGEISRSREYDGLGGRILNGNEQFTEYTFDIDPANLHEYSLVFEYLDIKCEATLNWSVSFELQNEVNIPHQSNPWEIAMEWEEISDLIFYYATGGADVSRSTRIYTADGEPLGTILASFEYAGFNHQLGEARAEGLRVRFYTLSEQFLTRYSEYNGLERCISEILPYPIPPYFEGFGVDLMTRYDSIPPEWRDKIMYAAQPLLALAR